MLKVYDYTPLLKDLKKLSIKHNIHFSKIKYIGYWGTNNTLLEGNYIIPEYGIIEFQKKCN